MNVFNNSCNDCWNGINRRVTGYYSDEQNPVRDYKGGIVNQSYINNYFQVSVLRFQVVCDLISSRISRNSSVLEIGPGYGFILFYLREMGYSVTGAELPENILAYSRALEGEEIPVKPYNIEYHSGKPDESRYDLVIASEVLEHLHMNLCSSILSLSRVCRTGGHILITVPNIYRLENYGKIARRENICEDFPDIPEGFAGPLGDLRTHPREPTMKDVTRAARACGLKIVYHGYFSSSLKRYHPLLSAILPAAIREHIIILAKKMGEETRMNIEER